MGRICKEVQEWVEEEVEKPIEEWEERTKEECKKSWYNPFGWKWVCSLVSFLVKVVRWVIVTVGKWITRVVCEVVSIILDIAAFIVSLVLSIPIIGGIIRTVLNWLTEIIWRIVGIFDFIGSLLGLRWRKKMYFGILIPTHDGKPLASQSDIQLQIDSAIEHMDRLCNVNLKFTGTCISAVDAPNNPLTYPCNAEGYFSDWWIQGSFYEFASSLCKFEDGWRRILGYGAEIIVIVVDNVTPEPTDGCSMGPTTNYVMTEPNTQYNMIVHEMGHACFLQHRDNNPTNLMSPTVLSTSQALTNWQISIIRSSRHCTYL